MLSTKPKTSSAEKNTQDKNLDTQTATTESNAEDLKPVTVGNDVAGAIEIFKSLVMFIVQRVLPYRENVLNIEKDKANIIPKLIENLGQKPNEKKSSLVGKILGTDIPDYLIEKIQDILTPLCVDKKTPKYRRAASNIRKQFIEQLNKEKQKNAKRLLSLAVENLSKLPEAEPFKRIEFVFFDEAARLHYYAKKLETQEHEKRHAKMVDVVKKLIEFIVKTYRPYTLNVDNIEKNKAAIVANLINNFGVAIDKTRIDMQLDKANYLIGKVQEILTQFCTIDSGINTERAGMVKSNFKNNLPLDYKRLNIDRILTEAANRLSDPNGKLLFKDMELSFGTAIPNDNQQVAVTSNALAAVEQKPTRTAKPSGDVRDRIVKKGYTVPVFAHRPLYYYSGSKASAQSGVASGSGMGAELGEISSAISNALSSRGGQYNITISSSSSSSSSLPFPSDSQSQPPDVLTPSVEQGAPVVEGVSVTKPVAGTEYKQEGTKIVEAVKKFIEYLVKEVPPYSNNKTNIEDRKNQIINNLIKNFGAIQNDPRLSKHGMLLSKATYFIDKTQDVLFPFCIAKIPTPIRPKSENILSEYNVFSNITKHLETETLFATIAEKLSKPEHSQSFIEQLKAIEFSFAAKSTRTASQISSAASATPARTSAVAPLPTSEQKQTTTTSSDNTDLATSQAQLELQSNLLNQAQTLIASLAQSKEKIDAHEAELAALKLQMSKVSGAELAALEGRTKELQGVLEKEKSAQAAEKERQTIFADDKLSDYYYVFILQFTSVYMACQSIYSKMVANGTQTTLETIADGVNTVGSQFTGIGLLTSLAAGAVHAWEGRDKKLAVNRMANFFRGIVDADTIIEALARKLTLTLCEQIRELAVEKTTGVFSAVVGKLKEIKRAITVDDIDNAMKQFSVTHVKKLLTAIMQDKISSHPTLADLDKLAEVITPAKQAATTISHAKSSEITAGPTVSIEQPEEHTFPSGRRYTAIIRKMEEKFTRAEEENAKVREELAALKKQLPNTDANADAGDGLVFATKDGVAPHAQRQQENMLWQLQSRMQQLETLTVVQQETVANLGDQVDGQQALLGRLIK